MDLANRCKCDTVYGTGTPIKGLQESARTRASEM
jgi:hypothetical protein